MFVATINTNIVYRTNYHVVSVVSVILLSIVGAIIAGSSLSYAQDPRGEPGTTNAAIGFSTPGSTETLLLDYTMTDANGIIFNTGNTAGAFQPTLVTLVDNPAPYTYFLNVPSNWHAIAGSYCWDAYEDEGILVGDSTFTQIAFQDAGTGAGGNTYCSWVLEKDDTFDDNLDDMTDQYNRLLAQVTALQAENDSIKGDVITILENNILASQTLLNRLQ